MRIKDSDTNRSALQINKYVKEGDMASWVGFIGPIIQKKD